MSTRDDVRRLAMELPEVVESTDHFAFSVMNGTKPKGFVWAWNERVHPKKPRIENPEVLAVRVPDLGTKELLLASDGEKFFTEPHYNGFPAVLVRLAAIETDELGELLADAWICMAPRALVQDFEKRQEL
jgi:hypothetical protein